MQRVNYFRQQSDDAAEATQAHFAEVTDTLNEAARFSQS
jgi:hypothetical protein